MPKFDTPEPISVVIAVATGYVKIVASDRADTVVEVSPSDRSKDSDIRAAQRMRVDYAGGKLLIKEPKQQWQQLYRSFRRGGSVDVVVELPSGSDVRGSSAWGTFRGEGRLGECRIDCDYGDIRLAETGPLNLTAAYCEINVDRVAGDAEVVNAAGDVWIGAVDGKAVIRNDKGASRIGEITGDLSITGTSGGIVVERAEAAVQVKTAYGNIRLDDIVRGQVLLTTASGRIEIGIREGTAAKLDVRSVTGGVRSSLNPIDGPARFRETVHVRARTQYGDVVIRRS